MSQQKQQKSAVPPQENELIAPPTDLVDGIPDRQANPPLWKYVLIAAIFIGWVSFLVYCLLAGRL